MYDLGPLKPGAFVRIFQHGRRFTAISLLAATLSSCGTFTNPGAPKQSFDIDKDIQELETVFSRSGSIAEYYDEFEKSAKTGKKSAKTDEQRKKGRDRFITGRLVLINIHYIEFIKQFAISKAQLDSAIDIATIGVDLAITLVGAASTKAILGAVSAGMTSSKVSIDKNFFQQKTVPVLISSMNAQRKIALLPILAGMKKPIEPVEGYSLAEAVADLHAYYNAGTFLGALQAIQKDSGVKEQEAEDKLAEFRETIFGEDKSATRIIKWLWPNGIDGAVNNANRDALRAWIDRDEGIKDLPIQKFLDSKQLKEARKRGIKDLQIPKLEVQ